MGDMTLNHMFGKDNIKKPIKKVTIKKTVRDSNPMFERKKDKKK